MYEQHKNFTPLPTYAIIAAHPSLGLIPLEKCIPGFSRVRARCVARVACNALLHAGIVCGYAPSMTGLLFRGFGSRPPCETRLLLEHGFGGTWLCAVCCATCCLVLNQLDVQLPRSSLYRPQVKALHGEQFLQLLGPLPPKANLVTRPQLLDVQDKGKGKGVVVVVREHAVWLESC